jgi:ribosome-associated GTPase EngA
MNNLPLVVIFGRTNVGKSTLFNCLTEKKQALVSNIEGTTRDSNIGEVEWRGISFTLVDTGGILDIKILSDKKKKFTEIDDKVQGQARDYLKKADLILFLTDGKSGLMPQDKQLGAFLKKYLLDADKVFLVVNKIDSIKEDPVIPEFNKLSFGEPFPVSASNGSRVGDLLDAVVEKINSDKKTKENYIFLHGFKRNDKVIDPFDWLNKKLSSPDNFNSPLPDPQKPNLKKQLDFVGKNAKINSNSIIIAHSLGGILALKLLEKNKIKIKKLILIASPFQTKKFSDGKERSELKNYGGGKYDFAKIKKSADEIIIIEDVNDPIILPEDSRKLASELGAELISLEAEAPHFNCEKSEKLLTIIQKGYLDIVRVSLIGKPNVGKSSLLNALLGYERVIVSDVPHTTREPQNIEINYLGNKIILVDTAGISKKGAKSRGLEKFGIEKSLSALKKSDIALLVLDINEEITHQDMKLVEEIVERKKSLLIIANKWDLIEERNTKKFTEYIYGKFPFIAWAPIQFVSALTGLKVNKIFDLLIEIKEKRKIKIPDTALDRFLKKIIKMHRPSRGKGFKHPRIYSLSQEDTNPPIFKLKIGSGEDLHFSYVRFMENRLRDKFDFTGSPITVFVDKKKKVHGRHKE